MKGDVHHVNDIIFLFRRRIMTVAAMQQVHCVQ